MSKATEWVKEWENRFYVEVQDYVSYRDGGLHSLSYSDNYSFRMFVTKFGKALTDDGFDFLDKGLHSYVYRYQNDRDLLKISTGWYAEFYFYIPEIIKPYFLDYNVVSRDGNCATQYVADCDDDSREKAYDILFNIDRNHKYNYGFFDGYAVIIDPY